MPSTGGSVSAPVAAEAAPLGMALDGADGGALASGAAEVAGTLAGGVGFAPPQAARSAAPARPSAPPATRSMVRRVRTVVVGWGTARPFTRVPLASVAER